MVGDHASLPVGAVLRATLEHVVGSREKVSVMVGRGGVAPMPEPASLAIVNDGAGVSLLRVDRSGASVSHTWHPTLAAAKERASAEYGVAESAWREEARG